VRWRHFCLSYLTIEKILPTTGKPQNHKYTINEKSHLMKDILNQY